MSEMNSAQKFFKKLEPLEQKLKKERDLKNTFGNKGAELIKEAFIIMKSQLGMLADIEDKGTVLVPAEYKQKVIRVSELFFVIAMEQPLTNFYRAVAKDYLILMSNWHRSIGRSKKMGYYILGTQRIMECTLALNDSIIVMRHLLRKLKHQMNYRPPAFDNARHYLQSLEEDIEKLGE